MASFVDALELEMARILVEPQTVDTIFLGGGTPTHLPPTLLERLLDVVTSWLPPGQGYEFSCEANPLDCDPTRLQILADAGVNRLSLGGQSFSNRKLKVLERDHSDAQLVQAIESCAEQFSNLSLDLIFAAPEESLAEWQGDIEKALQMPIKHLSTYGLTIERGSAFFGRKLRKDLTELDAGLQLAMYEFAIDRLAAENWEHYEVSNFAHPSFGCRHNQVYWQGRPWWAFGPGAASFTENGRGQMVRAVNQASTTGYLKRVFGSRSAVTESEILSREDRVRERLVFGLRQLKGVALQELDQIWGEPCQRLFEPYLSRYVEQGWLEWKWPYLKLTHKGLMISDSLWPDLLAPVSSP